jgi:hypothetical protein
MSSVWYHTWWDHVSSVESSTGPITGPGASKWGIGEAAKASREDTSGSAGNMTKTENITAAAPNATSQTNTGSSWQQIKNS